MTYPEAISLLIEAAEAHARDLSEMIGNTDEDTDTLMTAELDAITEALDIATKALA